MSTLRRGVTDNLHFQLKFSAFISRSAFHANTLNKWFSDAESVVTHTYYEKLLLRPYDIGCQWKTESRTAFIGNILGKYFEIFFNRSGNDRRSQEICILSHLQSRHLDHIM